LKFNPRAWIFLGILYICYVLYGTLLPFDFTFSLDVIQNNIENIEWMKQSGRSFYILRDLDAIANIFFFIPLGIIIFNVRSSFGIKRKLISDIVLATLAGLFLSTFIELAQLLLEERRTSLVDILMNTVGCFLGAIIGYAFSQFQAQSARQKIRHFIHHIPSVFLVIPFLLISLFISENLSFDFLNSRRGRIRYNWDYILRPYWIWLFLYAYIPISLFTFRKVKNRLSNVQLPALYIISFFISISVIGIIELIKYVVHTTSTLQENMVVASFGIIVGILFSEVSLENRLTSSKTVNRRIIYVLIGIYVIVGSMILYKSAYPFNFNFSLSYIFDKTLFSLLSKYSFIPFFGFRKLFIYSVQNILLYLPIGIILCELIPKINHTKKVLLIVISCIILIMIPFGIKILNKNLTPFIYEIPTNVLGIVVGYFIWFELRGKVKKGNDSI